jgi:hypothetical protein
MLFMTGDPDRFMFRRAVLRPGSWELTAQFGGSHATLRISGHKFENGGFDPGDYKIAGFTVMQEYEYEAGTYTACYFLERSDPPNT